MANRHLARQAVLQTLFEWDFTSKSEKDARNSLSRIVEDFVPELIKEPVFAEELLDGVLDKKKELDEIIEKAAPEWPIDKISITDRNVMRIGLYELLFADKEEVPPKVAINEAIELAKTFGGDASGKFVNGVLGAVYKEMGEPGKDQESKPKKKKKKFKNEDLPDDKLPVKKLGGAIVFARHEDDVYLALVHDVFGHWTLSKGHLEDGEDDKRGVEREIKEELGIKVKIGEKIGENSYIAYDPEEGKIKKTVVYYLAESDFVDLNLGKSGGLDDARWFKLKDILDLNFYDDILPLVTKAINILLSKNEKGKKN